MGRLRRENAVTMRTRRWKDCNGDERVSYKARWVNSCGEEFFEHLGCDARVAKERINQLKVRVGCYGHGVQPIGPPITVDTYTYFIDINGEYIKIGTSKEPARRLGQLQVNCPYEARLVGVLRGDYERELHKRFKHLRHRGEWFRLDKQILDLVAEHVKPFEEVALQNAIKAMAMMEDWEASSGMTGTMNCSND